MTKEIPFFIKKKQNNEMETKIPRNIIQTYKNNDIHNFIYNNIMNLLSINQDFNYYFITDDIGIDLIKTHFDEHTLEAFNRLNLGASKGDFLRYISIYVYGGVYLDLDSNINISLSSFIDSNIEHLFFMDYSKNIQQWCFMVSQKNGIILKIIEEMVKRIYDGVDNIFLATGPSLVTDVIYNLQNNTNLYFTTKTVSKYDRSVIFMYKNPDGIILNEEDTNLQFKDKFHFRIKNYQENMLYNNDKYIVTYGVPTPNFYKSKKV